MYNVTIKLLKVKPPLNLLIEVCDRYHKFKLIYYTTIFDKLNMF